MGKSRSSFGSDFSSAIGAGAGLGLGSSLGRAGGVTICNAQNQDTWYCKFSQAFGVFKMLLYFFIIIGIIVFLFYYFTRSGGTGKMKGGCGCGADKLW